MRSVGVAALVAVSWVGSALAAAEGPAGIWTTEDRDSKIRIAPCGKSFCATILWAKTSAKDENNPNPALRNRGLVGIELSRDIRPDGSGGWAASMYNPENGQTYKTTLQPKGGRQLEVGGCVLGGLLCGSETWQRSGETASTGSIAPSR